MSVDVKNICQNFLQCSSANFNLLLSQLGKVVRNDNVKEKVRGPNLSFVADIAKVNGQFHAVKSFETTVSV